MKLIMFTKMHKEKGIADLIELGHKLSLDGFDMAVRAGYPVNPENAASALPAAVRAMEAEGLSISMVTGEGGLLSADNPTAEPLVAAMEDAGVGLLKLGYYKLDPAQDYWAEVERIRALFALWAELGAKHGVKICYHTHCNRCMGLNAGMLAHLIRGFDPRHIGAFLDAGHLAAEGEEFDVAAAIAAEHLSIVALKDVLLSRAEKNGHGVVARSWVSAGQGVVDWTAVFETLRRVGFGGPVSVHCEFEVPDGADADALVVDEVAFFRGLLDGTA
jgi:sugar phosphate isomerase/epimerase